MKKKINAKYYEDNDLSAMMVKNKDKKKVYAKNTKRITMNISFESFSEANQLDRIMGMGYQNVLKTAIILGLKDLHNLVQKKKQSIKN